MYSVSLEKLKEKIRTFSHFGDAGHGGVTRYTLSGADIEARKEFTRRMQAIGARIEIDDIANMYATIPGTDPQAKRIVMASHSDSVKNGGNYDGILGVLTAMEILETIVREGITHRHPITAMIWTNEEGSLYPPAMMGSGIICNQALPAAIRDKYQYEDMMNSKSVLDAGDSFRDALQRSGYIGEQKNRFSAEAYKAMFEVHIEQGPILEAAGKDLGIVECVLGMFNYRLRFYGQTVHAGTFPMDRRKDALFAASQALVHLHQEIDKLGRPELVYTTGEIVCEPCVHTCVPGYVDFCIDVRHEDPQLLERVLEIVTACADREWAGCRCTVDKMWSRDTVYFDRGLISRLEKVAKESGASWQFINSGAGHDAQFASYLVPTSMLFVQSRDGISHNEAEYSSAEHCQAAASVLLNAVLAVDRE